MRYVLLLFIYLPLLLAGQPKLPDLAFVLVRDEKGRPLKGKEVESNVLIEHLSTKRRPAYTVQLNFTVTADYPYSKEEIGKQRSWLIRGIPIRKGRKKRTYFEVLNCWCTDQYIRIIHGKEIMIIDIPTGAEREKLVTAYRLNSPIIAIPEMIVLKPGRFSWEELRLGHEQHETKIVNHLD